MRIPFFQVDAFASQPFRGNPAAVCYLESWLPEATLQHIAAENNLSETAFVVAKGGHHELRWFTPRVEVQLCGHATLATAKVLWSALEAKEPELQFATRSGILKVRKAGERLTLDFPAMTLGEFPRFAALTEALGVEPQHVLVAGEQKFLAVLASEEEVAELEPDFDELALLEREGVIVTAPGSGSVDFVSRYFAPRLGVAEDPVTGSAHCALTPYWAKRLEKTRLQARQLSRRGGELECELKGDRVEMTGDALIVIQGVMTLPEAPAAA